MTDTEIIEHLTQTIEQQAAIIRQLHGIVKQLGAATSIDDDVTSILYTEGVEKCQMN